MVKIKISVIVPVYNTEKYLNKCLETLVNQTLREIEIIVIDDGSTDNSKEIIEEYSEKYEKIKPYYNTNHGIGYTRNFGIEKATGKYITFIDSDDFVTLSMLDKCYEKLEEEDLDVVICDFYKLYEKSNKLEKVSMPKFGDCTIEANKTLFFELDYAPWNKVYKRVLFNKYKFPENLKYEDFGVIPLILGQAKKIGKINEPLNYYLIRDENQTNMVDSKVFDILEIIDIVNNYYKNKPYYKDVYTELEYLNIKKLLDYNIQQRKQKDKTLISSFIDASFEYLNKNFPNWKKNVYYKKRSFLKKLIESNKSITKIYCKIYRSFV